MQYLQYMCILCMQITKNILIMQNHVAVERLFRCQNVAPYVVEGEFILGNMPLGYEFSQVLAAQKSGVGFLLIQLLCRQLNFWPGLPILSWQVSSFRVFPRNLLWLSKKKTALLILLTGTSIYFMYITVYCVHMTNYQAAQKMP